MTENHLLPDMQPEHIVGDYQETTLNYHDGQTRKILYTAIETPFPDGKLIVSVSDKSGVITHANEAFVTMSGYEKAELIGKPHAILRHPDMPQAAFAALWEDVQTHGRWKGYVKNLRKDGGFYWVYASVIANVRGNEVVGYTSVRRRPSQRKINEAIALYKTL